MIRFCCCILLLLLNLQPVNAAERVALVIGSDAYTTLRPLKQAVADADAIAAALRALPQPFTVQVLRNANLVTLRRELNRFRDSAKGGEVALVYFAGHGVQHLGDPYLLGVDTAIEEPADISSFGVPLAEVRDIVTSMGFKAGVIVLDACRNDLFAAGREPAGIRSAGLSRGLKRVESSNGLLIAYATAAGDVAREQAGARNSVYTSALLKKLNTPGLDLYSLFNQTALALSQGIQRPELMVSALEPVYLAGAGSAVLQPLPQASASGELRISVTPSDAEVYVDGGWIGVGAQTLKSLPANSTRNIEARKAGYQNHEIKAFIRAGDATVVSLSLTREASANPRAQQVLGPIDKSDPCLHQRLINFGFSEFNVRDSYAELLSCHARFLKKHPNAQLTLEGHTNPIGLSEMNLRLGEMRSRSVFNQLVKAGAKPTQLKIVSYGEERPSCTDHFDQQCQAQNSRVELIYTSLTGN